MLKSYNNLIALLEAFPDEKSCVDHLETIRWPCGIVCPHCGEVENHYRMARGHRYRCKSCKQDFSVRKGTIFEESRLPLRKWFVAIWLHTSHRKGIPSTELAREIGVTQKTAWFMLGRLREVAGQMESCGGPLEGPAEFDETHIGGKRKNMSNRKRRELKEAGMKQGPSGKQIVVGARSKKGKIKVQAINSPSSENRHGFLETNVRRGSTLYPDSVPETAKLPAQEREPFNFRVRSRRDPHERH